jgi:hypothetical protein
VPYHACEAASRYVPTHWIKPCVPGDCPMNEGGFLELLAYAKGLSSAQATSRGNRSVWHVRPWHGWEWRLSHHWQSCRGRRPATPY